MYDFSLTRDMLYARDKAWFLILLFKGMVITVREVIHNCDGSVSCRTEPSLNLNFISDLLTHYLWYFKNLYFKESILSVLKEENNTLKYYVNDSIM